MQAGGQVTGLAGRYASALFDLAESERAIDAVAASLDTLARALADSPDLRALIASPVVGREDATKAVLTLADDMQLDPRTRGLLGVLGRNRRLAALPRVIRAYRQLAARHRGELTAEVTSAHPLDDNQQEALRARLRAGLGQDVAIDLTVDPSLLGGLVVRVGSRLVDSSLKTKLEGVALAMKG